jgi:hypothetical protein
MFAMMDAPYCREAWMVLLRWMEKFYSKPPDIWFSCLKGSIHRYEKILCGEDAGLSHTLLLAESHEAAHPRENRTELAIPAPTALLVE